MTTLGPIGGIKRDDPLANLFSDTNLDIDFDEISADTAIAGPAIMLDPKTPPFMINTEPVLDPDSIEVNPYKSDRPGVAMRGGKQLNFGTKGRRPDQTKDPTALT